MQKILVIQTAFIGDVVLVTALLEDLHLQNPNAVLDILVRKGNETLFTAHPYLNEVLIWQKKENKYANLYKVIYQIQQNKYDRVINVQRFAATGFITVLSGAK
ncbi:MAG: glycosyltransferase family 9 protein, partial [Bacteroidota bacterium]